MNLWMNLIVKRIKKKCLHTFPLKQIGRSYKSSPTSPTGQTPTDCTFRIYKKNFQSLNDTVLIDVLTNKLPLEIISNDTYYHHQQSRLVHHHFYLYVNVSIGEQYSFETFRVVDAMMIDFELVLDNPV